MKVKRRRVSKINLQRVKEKVKEHEEICLSDECIDGRSRIKYNESMEEKISKAEACQEYK